jgi:hypothetical protein
LAYLEIVKQEKNWFKIIIALFFFCGFLFFGLFDILEKDSAGKSDKQEGIDSTMSSSKQIQDKIRTSVDSTKKAILDSITSSANNLSLEIKKRNLGIELAPILDLSADYSNPYMEYAKDSSSIRYNMVITNYGNDPASNLVDDIVIINYHDNKPNFSEYDPNHLANKTTTVPPNKEDKVLFSIDLVNKKGIPIRLDDKTVYVYLKIQYTNSKNKKMPVFRRIFAVEANETYIVNSTTYNRIEADLIKNKSY